MSLIIICLKVKFVITIPLTYGNGVLKYIDTLKIGKSIEILLTTDSTISNISEHLGFSSSSTYSKMFKSYMDITPNEYRNLSKI